MEAVPFPHKNWKQALLKGEIESSHFEQFGRLLASIHTQSSHLKSFRADFADTQFFESLRLAPYYAFTAKQVPEASDFLHQLITDTRKVKQCLVHGDLALKTYLLYQNNLVLLDHEVAHFGDGAFDIGFSMTHFLSKARHMPSFSKDLLSAAQHYWNVYQENAKPTPEWEARAVRHTIACMLARVRGKSQLEYLSETSKQEQLSFCLSLHSPVFPESMNSVDR